MAVDLDVAIEAGPHAAAAARRSLDSVRSSLSPDVFDDARLLVSELVTNSYRHAGLEAGDAIRIQLLVRPRDIYVEVHDPGRFKMPAGLSDDSGWGLRIVKRLSNRWGVRRDHGTTVWFEMSRHHRTGPDRSALSSSA